MDNVRVTSQRTMKSLVAAVLFLAVVNQAWGNDITTIAATASKTIHHALPQGTTVTTIPTINRTMTSSTSLKEVTAHPSRGTTSPSQTFSKTEGNHTTSFTNLTVTSTSSYLTQPAGNTTLPTTDNTTVSTSTDASKHGSSTLPSASPPKTQPAVTTPGSTYLAIQSTIGEELERGDNVKTDPSFDPEDKSKTEESPTLNRKGLFIGVGCVVAVIIFVVFIFLYKICQKKPPEPQNTGTKVSAQSKESVKLLSVKTSAPDSDLKRTTSPHHTDYIVEF